MPSFLPSAPRQRAVLGAVVALLIALVIAIPFLLMGGDDAPEAGLVIVDGERLEPPFRVTTSGAEVSVNGVLAASLAPLQTQDVAVAQAADNDAYDMVDQARRAYESAGGGEPGEAAALTLLASHPAAPSATVLDEPRRIEVTDGAGNVASLQLDTPDSIVRAVTDGGEAAAATTAEEWRALLTEGGGIVTSTTGVTLLVPAAHLEEFVQALDAALALDGAARDTALADVLDAPALIEEHGGTAPSITDYLEASTRARAIHPVAGDLLGRSVPAVLQAGAGNSKTPGKKEGYTLSFTALDDSDRIPYVRALQAEDYNMLIVRNPADLRGFAQTSRTGALYNVTHSSPNGLAVVLFPSADAMRSYVQLLRDNRLGNDLWYVWQEAAAGTVEGGDTAGAHGGNWWLSLRPRGIQAFWRSNDTIVHSASCSGAGLAPAFSAREFFGYAVTTSCAITLPDTQKLWERWSGKDGFGRYRSANRAFAQGGFSGGFRYVDGSTDGDTVLSPSVIIAEAPDLAVGGQGAVLVGFDAVMDVSGNPNFIIEVAGCAVPLGEPVWQFDSLLSRPISAATAGTYTVTVDARYAHSPAGIQLDGNQAPEGIATGVIPNRDPYIFQGRCLAPDLTPTTGIDPGTPSLEATAIDFGTVTPVPQTDGPTVEEIVLIIGGEHYPALQFISAQPDACGDFHYHAHQPVRSLEGTVIEVDPDPNNCGFGKLSEVPSETVQWPKDLYDAWAAAAGQ